MGVVSHALPVVPPLHPERSASVPSQSPASHTPESPDIEGCGLCSNPTNHTPHPAIRPPRYVQALGIKVKPFAAEQASLRRLPCQSSPKC